MLAEAGDEAKVLAGGQSLMPLPVYRLARPTHLVDISGLPGLSQIHAEAGGLVTGALARHLQFEQSIELDGPWRAIREATGLIGHYPIRVRGTFGGSISHADPRPESPHGRLRARLHHGRGRHPERRRCGGPRIALGSVGPTPLRTPEAEAGTGGVVLAETSIAEAAGLAASGCSPPSDAHAGSEFRRELVTVLVTRALRRLKEER